MKTESQTEHCLTNHPIKVAFVVDNVAAAMDFYSKTLDLEVDAVYPSEFGPEENFVFLKSKTIYLELLPYKAMDGAPVGFHHLAFWSDDVQRHLDDLKARGAKITSQAFPAGVGGITLGDLEGPGGVRLRLFNQQKLEF